MTKKKNLAEGAEGAETTEIRGEEKKDQDEQKRNYQSGFVAIVGRPNAGKGLLSHVSGKVNQRKVLRLRIRKLLTAAPAQTS